MLLLAIAFLVAGCTPKIDSSATFSPEGVSKVIIRASLAKEAKVDNSQSGSNIFVTGTPSGGSPGYHPASGGEKEIPAEKWGLKFVGEKVGTVLVISSKNEISYIHHHYYLSEIQVKVPPNIQVILETRNLSGNGAPDLSAPK